MNYLRQHRLFDPRDSHKRLAVIGAGGVGSFLVFNLAKMGFSNITVFDGDEVEEHNVPNQLFGNQHIGEPKVEALARIVKGLTGVDINPVNAFVEEQEQLPMGDDVLYVFSVDSLEIRKELFSLIEGSPNMLVDGRMGGENFEIICVDLTDEEDVKRYRETLKGETAELPCGERAIIYTLIQCTGEMTNQIKRIDAGQRYAKQIVRNMNNLTMLGAMKR